MSFFDQLKFDANGLIPAIIQDRSNGRVLMMAWMNRASLEKTLETGKTHFWSRSRQKFWMKGESSGHTQAVKDVAFDCDGDTLLIQVEQIGAACHEGYRSCFFRSTADGGNSFKVTEPQLETPEQMYRQEIVAEILQSEFVRFGGRGYWLIFALLVFGRGMDFLSTWVATPNMVLEGNPVAKKLGWRWGIPLNFGICFALALWPLPAIVLVTTSFLVAARNFQSAWLMRSLGEYFYRDWHHARIQETSAALYVFCLLGQTLLTGSVGAAVIWFSYENPSPAAFVPLTAIGMGIVAYAVAVAFFTLLAVYRMRRAALVRPREP